MDIHKLDKKFYTIEEVAKRWECSVNDVDHIIYEQKLLRLSVRFNDTHIYPAPHEFMGVLNFFGEDNHKGLCSFEGSVLSEKKETPIFTDFISSPSPSICSVSYNSDFIYLALDNIFSRGNNTRIFYNMMDSGLHHLSKNLETEGSPRYQLLNSEDAIVITKAQLFDETSLKYVVTRYRQIWIEEFKCSDIVPDDAVFDAIAITNADSLRITHEELVTFEAKHFKKDSSYQITQTTDNNRNTFQLPQKPDEAARHMCEMGNKYIQQHSRTPIETELREYIISENNKWLEPNMNSGGILTIGGQRVTKRGFKDRYKRYLTDIDES